MALKLSNLRKSDPLNVYVLLTGTYVHKTLLYAHILRQAKSTRLSFVGIAMLAMNLKKNQNPWLTK